MTHKLIEVDSFYDDVRKQWHYGDILRCEQDCGCAVRKPTEPNATDRGLPYQRISHEREIEEAIVAGKTGEALVDAIRRYTRGHSWSSADWFKIEGLKMTEGQRD